MSFYKSLNLSFLLHVTLVQRGKIRLQVNSASTSFTKGVKLFPGPPGNATSATERDCNTVIKEFVCLSRGNKKQYKNSFGTFMIPKGFVFLKLK